VADVGSGTGIFSAQLLKAGATVFAVEPNSAMRAEAEANLGNDLGFVSLDATAEDLPFEDSVLDLITCAQSFHWFNPEAARREFARTLHGAGYACMFWNKLDKSKTGATEILRASLDLAQERTGKVIEGRGTELTLTTFFAPGTRFQKVFRQMVDMSPAMVITLARSRSYWPDPDSELAQELEADLTKRLAEEAVRGIVHINYTTELTGGQFE
jgi:ubiquinone/menaquinone biosynthesis C-methylase UbiE